MFDCFIRFLNIIKKSYYCVLDALETNYICIEYLDFHAFQSVFFTCLLPLMLCYVMFGFGAGIICPHVNIP